MDGVGGDRKKSNLTKSYKRYEVMKIHDRSRPEGTRQIKEENTKILRLTIVSTRLEWI